MICNKCGIELDDNVKVCPACGEQLVTNTENGEADTVFAQPSFDEEKPAKKKKGRYIAIGTGALAVVLALLLVFNFDFIKGLFGGQSEAERYRSIEKRALAEAMVPLYDYYDLAKKSDSNVQSAPLSVNASVEIELSEQSKELLSLLTNTDLSWLDGTKINYNGTSDANAIFTQIALESDGITVLAVDQIVDYLSGKIYLKYFPLVDKYLASDISVSDMDDAQNMGIMLSKIKSVLPEKDTLKAIADRYIDVILGSFDDSAVTSSKEELEIVGKKVEATAYQLTIDDNTLQNVIVRLLEELANDGEIEKIINDLETALGDTGAKVDGENEKASDAFKKSVNEALAEIKNDGIKFDEKITLVTYVNKNDEIIGRGLKSNSEELFTYVSVSEGEDFYVDIDLADKSMSISGSGKEQNGVINAKYSLNTSGIDVININVTDLNLNPAEPTETSGTIEIAPSAFLMNMLGSSMGDDFDLNPSVKIEFSNGKTQLNLFNGSELILGIKLSADIGEGTAITFPDAEQIVENIEEIVIDDAAIEEAFGSTDLGKFLLEIMGQEAEDDYFSDTDVLDAVI